MAKPREVVPPPAWHPAPYKLADVAAVQACARGDASPDQQQRALTWIINDVARTYDLEYRTDGRDHAFLSGRRHVGLQLVTALKLKLSALKEE